MGDAELERGITLLHACWTFFDGVAARVSLDMRKGPRGGGRDRDRIIRHTIRTESEEFAKHAGLRILPYLGHLVAGGGLPPGATFERVAHDRPETGNELAFMRWPPAWRRRAPALVWFLIGRIVIGFTWRDALTVRPLNGEQAIALAVLVCVPLTVAALGATVDRGSIVAANNGRRGSDHDRDRRTTHPDL